ncbi:hypothetical protein M527_07035 [Sphingobium indicum IP26]|uniref:Head-tail adaptor protein n=1 Tax=Sphingobium indicum F2 TaxID=1450518 RepID=A0A8E1C380_9SPHN|nr:MULTISPECIES: phage head closure protein [Sphingobium]EPR09875.1 hypothetical protein M527_07035 [Sphingobium indicum IP26]EQB05003.1 hypothetical protein L286_09550 [Sphingobium sp. HDIP04]KER36668.1 hypothetical protein AL00_09340 [Sphingobium indicum F2]
MKSVVALRLNRRVTILRRAEARDPTYNTVQVEWVPLGSVWAEVRDLLPSRAERVAEAVDLAQRPSRVRMRYRTDVDTTKRLSWDGRTFLIVSGPAELGNREGIELVAEELSTVGQEP